MQEHKETEEEEEDEEEESEHFIALTVFGFLRVVFWRLYKCMCLNTRTAGNDI